MNVLIVASEGVPFAKTGGLADVVGSLPKALAKAGSNVRVILPKYGTIPDQYKDKMQHITATTVAVGWRDQYCGIEEVVHDGIHYYFIDNQYYFNRERLYDFYDEAERFAFFSRAVLAAIPHLDFQPDIIHCHDWQTALVSVFLKSHYLHDPMYMNIKTILTVHNLKFQGVFPKIILHDLLKLGEEHFTPDSLEFFGNVNYLKGGIFYSDLVTTVSKTYAEEIKHSYFGENLEGVMRKKDTIYGIVNGIDYDTYDPMKDEHIECNYRNSLVKKSKNKEVLQDLLGLPVNKDIPMIGIISRLTSQKGLDLIEGILHELLSDGIQFVVLGTGEYEYEELFRAAARRYPDQISAQIAFDEGMARKIYAGTDMFLMPSKFEPCGLSQLIALRYGSIPIVRETGGLKDTILSFNEETGKGNGFTFTDYNAHDMLYTIRRAIKIYRQDKEQWTKLTLNAVKSDYSWKSAAKEYVDLYAQLIK